MPTSETRWILIAEDDDEIRQLLRESLKNEAEGDDLEVVEARDGREALGKASTREFHCVITDLKMPNATGEEFLRKLQTQPLNANTPTLVISGYAQNEFREFCERSQHIRIIPKPFQPSTVAQAALREIRLGRIDDRVSLHLMNPFLEAARLFIEEDLKLTPNLGTPAVKKSGAAPTGDFHGVLSLSSGLSRARFSLGFDTSFLTHARKTYFQSRISQTASLAREDIARVACQALFDRALKALKLCMAGTPRLSGLAMTEQGADDFDDLVSASGASVTITTDQGRVIASALSPGKIKR